MTKSETILQALEALLATTGKEVQRNIPIPVEIPVGGLIILRDGEPGEPVVTMSPLAYEYFHRVTIEVFVQKKTGREAVFDGIKAAIGSAIAGDRSLGGHCLWVEPEAPTASALPFEGAASVLAAEIGVTLHYLTSDPLA